MNFLLNHISCFFSNQISLISFANENLCQIEVSASNCNNACLEQISLYFVWCSLGTVFLARWILSHLAKFHFLHLLYHAKKERRSERGLSQSDVIRKRTEAGKGKMLPHRMEISFSTGKRFKCSCCCCVFNTWEIYFQVGLICVFPWIHIIVTTRTTLSARSLHQPEEKKHSIKAKSEKMDFKNE